MKIFVMLLFFMDRYGVGASIQGFHSLDACNKAIPAVVQNYAEMSAGMTSGIMMSKKDLERAAAERISVRCVALGAD